MRVVVDGWAWIDIRTTTAEVLQKLREQLTIKRRKVGSHPGDAPGPVYLFREDGDYFGVPRSYFFENARQQHDIEYRVTDGASWPGPVRFTKTLFPEQKECCDKIVRLCQETPTFGGIVKSPTGTGKSVMAANIAVRLARCCVILVHKAPLMDQWEDSLKEYLDGVVVGRVVGDTSRIDGCHFVICMVQTLASRQVSDKLSEFAGVCISDEVHRIPAETWSPIIPQFSSRFRLGLSATVRRRDGAEAVYEYHIGKIAFEGKVLRMKPKVRRVWTRFHHKGPTTGPMQKVLLLKALCADLDRNGIITNQMMEAIRAGRKILCLSERKQQLVDLANMMAKFWDPTWGLAPKTVNFTPEVAKEMSKDERNEVFGAASCIFSTFQLVSEGFDYPPFDTLCLASPIYDAEQSVGRILRTSPNKKDPIVIDIRDDDVALCRTFAEERDRLYDVIAA